MILRGRDDKKILEFDLFLVPVKIDCLGDFFHTLLGYQA